MNREEMTAQPKSRWFIDVGWFPQNRRSLLPLVQNGMCPKCRARLGEDVAVPVETLVATVKDCCGDAPEFISPRLPILENVFRLFLANGNQPLGIEELSRQLRERLGDTYRTSPEILSRLLPSDQYYGLRLARD